MKGSALKIYFWYCCVHRTVTGRRSAKSGPTGNTCRLASCATTKPKHASLSMSQVAVAQLKTVHRNVVSMVSFSTQGQWMTSRLLAVWIWNLMLTLIIVNTSVLLLWKILYICYILFFNRMVWHLMDLQRVLHSPLVVQWRYVTLSAFEITCGVLFVVVAYFIFLNVRIYFTCSTWVFPPTPTSPVFVFVCEMYFQICYIRSP